MARIPANTCLFQERYLTDAKFAQGGCCLSLRQAGVGEEGESDTQSRMRDLLSPQGDVWHRDHLPLHVWKQGSQAKVVINPGKGALRRVCGGVILLPHAMCINYLPV